MCGTRVVPGLLLVSTVLLTGACRRQESRADASPVIRVATTLEPDVLLPLFSDGAGAAQVIECGQRFLTRYAPDGSVVPSLAEKVPTAGTPDVVEENGGLRVTWRLRDGLTWSDGKALTAADFVAAHAVFMDAGQHVRDRSMAEKVRSMDAPDARTLVVHWKEPYAFFHAYRNHVVLPAHVLSSLRVDGGTWPDLKTHAYARSPLWQGPFMLLEWQAGSHLRMVPVRGATTGAREIVFRVAASEQAALNMLEAGEVDALAPDGTVTADNAAALAARRSDLQAHLQPGLAWAALSLNVDDPWLADVRVRRALALALDRQAAVNTVFHGRYRVVDGLFPSPHPGAVKDAPAARDLAAANALLDSAGFPRGEDGTRRAPDGRVMELDVVFASGIKATLDLLTVMQHQWAEAGVKVRLEPRPFRVLAGQTLRERKQRHLAFSALTWDPMGYGDTVVGSRFIPSSENGFQGQNHAGWRNAEVDALLERIPRTLDADARTAMLQQVSRAVMREVPLIPVYSRPTVSMTRRGLGGWSPTGTPTPVCWNAETWTLSASPH